MVINKPPEVDFWLFKRPFTNQSWLFILISFSLIFTMLFMVQYKSTKGYVIIELIAWLLFVILYAFYGGALTMFFTNEPSLPFNTIGIFICF